MSKMGWHLAGALVAVIAGSACFSPSYQSDLACNTRGECPPGQSCGADGICRYVHPGDAQPSTDSPVADAQAAQPDASCPTSTMSFGAIADAVINSGSGSEQNKGGLAVANVGVGINSVGLFRFDIGDLPEGVEPRAARLVLTYAEKADECGSSCGTCSGIDTPGNLVLFYLRSDWNELQCTHTLRATGQSWASAGAASDGIDRSAMLATAMHLDDSSTTFELGPDELSSLWTWRLGDEVSFLVAPTNGAVMILATKESQTIGCMAYAAPVLEIDYCE